MIWKKSASKTTHFSDKLEHRVELVGVVSPDSIRIVAMTFVTARATPNLSVLQYKYLYVLC